MEEEESDGIRGNEARTTEEQRAGGEKETLRKQGGDPTPTYLPAIISVEIDRPFLNFYSFP